jgi:hypothetical protein
MFHGARWVLLLLFCATAMGALPKFIPQDLAGHPEFMATEKGRSVLDITDKWTLTVNEKDQTTLYQKEITLPADWKDKRVFLWIDNAGYGEDINVNDTAIGTFLHCDHFYGCVEITSAVQPGKANRFRVQLQPASINNVKDKYGKDSRLAPCSGQQPEGVTFWDHVRKLSSQFYGRQFLIATPRSYIPYVKIDPNTGQKRIRLSGSVAGQKAGPGQILAELYEIGIRPEPRLVTEYKPECVSRASLDVAAGAGDFAFALPFPKDAKLWTPDHPFLYLVKVKLLIDGNVVDTYIDRTGLRTVGIQGDQFTLNGQLFLPRLAFTTRSPMKSHWSLEYCLMRAQGLKSLNLNLFRNHGAPPGRWYYPIADQYGMGAIPQPDNVSIAFGQPDHPMWEYWKLSIARMVRQTGNSPSVLMWSAENENLSASSYIDRDGSVHKGMWEVNDFFKKLDSRPVIFEGDGDLRGKADVYNEHYPFEHGEYNWPVDHYWLDKPHFANNADIRNRGKLVLSDLKKPLMFGETMWFPTGGPLTSVAFVGDKSYEWFQKYPHYDWRTPDGLSNQDMLARAYNIQKVAAFVVQTAGALSQYNKFHCNNPLAVFLKEEFRQYFGGDVLKRTYVVCNSTDTGHQLTLKGSLILDGREVVAKSESLTVAAGDRIVKEMALDLPKVARLHSGTLKFELFEGEALLDVSEQQVKVYPRERHFTASIGRIGIFDPSGKTIAALKKLNVQGRAISGVTSETLKDMDLLVIGEGAVKAPSGFKKDGVTELLDRGGNLLVLAQAPSADLTWLPIKMELATNRPATMVHVVTPHDLLRIRNLEPGDFHWWLDDHFVSRSCYSKPLVGNVRSILDVGAKGLDYTPLIEIFSGKGIVVLNQLVCVEKFDTAPVAAEVLYSCVEYGLTTSRTMGKLGIIAPADASLLERLKRVKADYELLNPDQITESNLCRLAALLVPPTKEAWKTAIAKTEIIRPWVFRHGGKVILHRLDPSVVSEGEASGFTDPRGIKFGSRLEWKGQIYKLSDAMKDEFACGLSNEWLWWIPEGAMEPTELQQQPEHIFDYPIGMDDRTQHQNDDWLEITNRGALNKLKFGNGMVIIDQLRWDVNQELLGKQLAYLRWLLTACKVRMENTPASPIDRTKMTFVPIDIRAVCNQDYVDDGTRNSWFGFGPHQDLRTLPTGRQIFADVDFEIIDPKQNGGKGCLAMHGQNGEQFPRKAGPVPVNAKFNYLVFHQASAWSRSGDVIGTYEITYTDGESVFQKIVEGKQVCDWWHGGPILSDALPAWVGQVSDGHKVATHMYLWKNPHPDRTIKSITIHAGDPSQRKEDQILPHGLLGVLSITGIR